MALLVVNNMLNVMSLIIISPSRAQYSQPTVHRHIISYTANIIHRIIIWRLTSLLNKLSQINNWLFVHKKTVDGLYGMFLLTLWVGKNRTT